MKKYKESMFVGLLFDDYITKTNFNSTIKKQPTKTVINAPPKGKTKFTKLDQEFWDAQDEWEKEKFSTTCKAWKTMWTRVQHATYNILFKKLIKHNKSQDDIESLSFEIASNIMEGFQKKVAKGKEWKVKAPIAGYCSPQCMRIYAPQYQFEDKVSLMTDAGLVEAKNDLLEEEDKKYEES